MLTDRLLATTKPDPTKATRLSDGGGLYLLIRPDGKRWWRFDYTYAGRRKGLSFGVYPTVTLARAREKRLEARRLLDRQIDPSVARKRAKVERSADTFQALAEEWIAKKEKVREPRTLLKLNSILKNYLLPALGSLPMRDILAMDVLAPLRPLDHKGLHETAHRARGIAGEIFRYAVATGRATRDVTADLAGALTPVKVTHYAALTDPPQIGQLIRAIDACDVSPIVCTALQIAPRVFVRPGELRGAEWCEIDLDRAIWRIGAARMKMRDEHLVPLSTQVVALLRTQAELTGAGRLVFPSPRQPSRSISDGTLTAALRRLGYGPELQSVHGFRTIASTRLNELGWNPELIELQLAHVDRNPVRAAYNRALRLDERTAMMQAYADHLAALKSTAERSVRLAV